MKNKIKKAKQVAVYKFSRRKMTLLSCLIALVLLAIFWVINYSGYMVKTTDGISFENKDKIQLEKELIEMTAGYPIQQMVPFIVKYDNRVAAFIVSIAKKESNWGKRHPKLNNRDCYNYWGYRKKSAVMTWDGYTCFSTPEEAVDAIAGRISYLVNDQQLDTPDKMIVWKCGSTCAGHSPYGVQKWISDVNLYFKKILHF